MEKVSLENCLNACFCKWGEQRFGNKVVVWTFGTVLHCLASKDKDAYYVYLQELTKVSK